MYYEETQKFRGFLLAFVLLILSASFSVILFGLIKQTVLHESFGDKPAPTFILFIILFFQLFLIWFFLNMKLEIQISNQFFRYQFFPFHWSFRVIKFSEIESFEFIEVKGIKNRRGIGIKYHFKKTKSFIISGNHCISLKLKNGITLIFGTKKPEDLKRILEKSQLH